MAGIRQEERSLTLILEKLKRHAEYYDKDEAARRDLARNFTDVDEIFGRFSHLLEPVADKAIDAALVEYRAVYTHDLEYEMAHKRAKHDLARVFHLPVKLFLSRLKQPVPSIAGKISQVFMEYGALHAGLVVGNVRIEWGQEGIVDALPEVDVPGDDFVGSVDGRLGHLAHAAADIHPRFSLADRERRTDDKIKLIINSAERKEQVLRDLVTVIVRYNREKSYDLFTCNCQHFVREALLALGITDPPRFSGQLKEHLEHLKRGKFEVPEDLMDHDGLDAYVERQLQAEPGTLSQHDMEYLLLHYYRLHLATMPRDCDETWRCRVPSCKYEHLADRVKRESLQNNQFLPRPPSVAYSPSTPVIQELPSSSSRGASVEAAAESKAGTEAVTPEEEQRRKEELRRQQIDEDERTARQIAVDHIRQKQLYERHITAGYHYAVVRKLRTMQEYREASDEDIDKVVMRFTEFEEFRDAYDCFPATVEETSKGHTMDAVADREWREAERLSHEGAIRKVQQRFDALSTFPIKLVLRVKPGEQEVGHGAYEARLEPVILIHDHMLQWNSCGLVIPRRIDFQTFPPVLTTPILLGSKWSTYICKMRSKMKGIVKGRPGKLQKEIKLLFELTAKKDSLIAAVIKLAIDYNRNKQYDERDCNSGHFILDVLATMGVVRLPEIRESLGQQLEEARVLCAETLPRTEFADHAELDGFVRSRCQNDTLSLLSIADTQYLVCKYFFFHVRHWQLSPSSERKTCEKKQCQLKQLEKHLETLSLSSEDKCVVL